MEGLTGILFFASCSVSVAHTSTARMDNDRVGTYGSCESRSESSTSRNDALGYNKAHAGKHDSTQDVSDSDLEATGQRDGNPKFHQLGWKRLTILAMVEAIALGSLGLPRAFATLGMAAGVLLSVGIGLVAMYAAYNIGQVKLKFPQVSHYADVGSLLFGPIGSSIFVAAFVLLLIFVVGSHCLTGAIAFKDIVQTDICSTAFSAISAAILLFLAIPPSFADIAILGYIDFASIILAIGITMIATGVQDRGNLGDVEPYIAWSAWPKEGITFEEAIVSVNSIVFAYSFGGCLPSFMGTSSWQNAGYFLELC